MACSTVSVFLCLLFLSAAQSLSNNLNGQRLRVGYVMAFRANVTEAEISNASVPTCNCGHLNFAKWASRRNNFTIEYVVLNRAASVSEQVGQFKTKRIDLILSSFGLLHGRNADTLTPHDFDTLCAIIPTPGREPNIWSFVLPYTAMVWLCFFASMVVSVVLLKLLTSGTRSIRRNHSESTLTWTNSFNYVFGVATNQGAYFSPKSHSVRVGAALWCLAALVMVNAYSGSLITYMTVAKVTPLLKSVEDLPTRPDLGILAYPSSFAGEVIKNTTRYKPVIDNFRKFPRNFCGTVYNEVKKCYSLVKEGGYVYVAMGKDAVVDLTVDFKGTKTCDLSRTEECSGTYYATYLVPLDSPREARNALDVSILEATSYGLFQKWRGVLAYRDTHCQRSRTRNQSLKKLTLVDYSSAFVILAIGTALGVVAFIAEQFLMKPPKRN